jgi:trehalose 6-phosphate synthase
VEWPPRHDVPADQVPQIRAQLLEELGLPGHLKIGLGVDRLDYTKGITERLLAIERLLEIHPELVGKFVFIQIAAPSRSQIPSYQDLESEVRELATRINFRFQRPDAEPPILLRIAHHDSAEVFRYYRTADVCLVTSLHDGMNLVAKEYVSSRSDLGGMLVLSTFTGAASEMLDALLVNPYDIDQTAGAIYHALMMEPAERLQRNQRLRETVSTKNVYAWAAHFLGEVHRIAMRRDPVRAAS